jgi:hypothetical protein
MRRCVECEDYVMLRKTRTWRREAEWTEFLGDFETREELVRRESINRHIFSIF